MWLHSEIRFTGRVMDTFRGDTGPWLSSRKRRVSNPLMKLTPGSRYRGRCNPRWPSRAGKLLVDESKQRVGNNGIVRHGERGGCNS